MIDRARDWESAAAGTADSFAETAADYAATAREKLFEGKDMVKEFISSKPAAALGIALGVGVFLGWMIKRR